MATADPVFTRALHDAEGRVVGACTDEMHRQMLTHPTLRALVVATQAAQALRALVVATQAAQALVASFALAADAFASFNIVAWKTRDEQRRRSALSGRLRRFKLRKLARRRQRL